ncbi:hypothetical protein K439DRAFT_1656828 [Ramaria rubella]|nr:hypothetical protein K439DRAFT_1656828 [Ramaria rubella]
MSHSSHGGGASAPSPNSQGLRTGGSKKRSGGNAAHSSDLGDVFSETTPGPRTPPRPKTQNGEYVSSPSGTSPANQKRKVAKNSPVSNRTDTVLQNAHYSPSQPPNIGDDMETESGSDGESQMKQVPTDTDLEEALMHCKQIAFRIANAPPYDNRGDHSWPISWI